MTHEVLQELWNAKDNIAKEHAYDIDNLVAFFQFKSKSRAETNAQGNLKKKAETTTRYGGG